MAEAFYISPQQRNVGGKRWVGYDQASVTLRQVAGQSELIIITAVRTESAFMGHNYSLGLDKALEIIKTIEQGAKSSNPLPSTF